MEQYAEYKDSGIGWIGDIPIEWDVVKLKRLCRIKRGASPRPIDDPIFFDDDGERYWVRISDVTNSQKYLIECEQKLSKLGIENSVKVDEGQIFVSICASVGKPCISKVKACIHDGFVLLQDLPSDYVNYVYYIFELETPCHGLGKIGTQLNLNSETLGSIYITIHGNVRMVSCYLDRRTAEIDAIIADLQNQAEMLELYKRELIVEAVTQGINKTATRKHSGVDWIGEIPVEWTVLPLRGVAKDNAVKNDGMKCNNLLSLSYGRIIQKDIDTNFGLLPANFEGYQIVHEGYTVLRLTDLQNDKRSLRTGYVGETGIITSAYTALVPSEDIYGRYFQYLLHAYDLKKIFYGLGGGVRQSLKYSDLRMLPVLIPPMPVQKAIVAYIEDKTDQVNGLIADINRQIENLKKYRQIVIHDAVTGKIKVTEGTDNGN